MQSITRVEDETTGGAGFSAGTSAGATAGGRGSASSGAVHALKVVDIDGGDTLTSDRAEDASAVSATGNTGLPMFHELAL